YEAKVEDLWENEIDYVFIGTYDGEVHPNPAEVSDYKWMPMPDLMQDIQVNSDDYTPWFRIIMKNNDFFSTQVASPHTD
ncbi:MAG: NUDIX domain-containing protein, partial [Oscillospiraceae bacterium]|nr:NUDIX domain-containing protein [Oscillospiraceae bacterium]